MALIYLGYHSRVISWGDLRVINEMHRGFLAGLGHYCCKYNGSVDITSSPVGVERFCFDQSHYLCNVYILRTLVEVHILE